VTLSDKISILMYICIKILHTLSIYIAFLVQKYHISEKTEFEFLDCDEN
jgi:hypothetical protein